MHPELPEADQLAARAEQWRRENRDQQWAQAVPRRFVAATLADLADQAPDVRQAITSWAMAPDGRNLLVLGPVGVGKTHALAAACRAQHMADPDATVVFAPVVELFDDLRPGGPVGRLRDCTDATLLALDDLAAERDTDWTHERLYAIINRRWMEARPTACTTNLPPEQLHQQLGERMYSRLVGDAVVVRLAGPDRRRHRG
jgi:DNA replication protein DnaC